MCGCGVCVDAPRTVVGCYTVLEPVALSDIVTQSPYLCVILVHDHTYLLIHRNRAAYDKTHVLRLGLLFVAVRHPDAAHRPTQLGVRVMEGSNPHEKHTPMSYMYIVYCAHVHVHHFNSIS